MGVIQAASAAYCFRSLYIFLGFCLLDLLSFVSVFNAIPPMHTWRLHAELPMQDSLVSQSTGRIITFFKNILLSLLLLVMAAMTFEMFLLSVDTHVQRTPEFLAPVIACFTQNGVSVEEDLIGMRYEMLGQLPQAGHAAFIMRAILCANERAARVVLPGPVVASDGMQQLAKVMRREDPVVHIDMERKLSRTYLSEVPQSCLADGTVTDSLATEIVRLQKKAVRYPFVYVDLRKYLPFWCADKFGERDEPSDDESSAQVRALQDLAKHLGKQPKAKRRLSFVHWMVAFDRCALTADACDQSYYHLANFQKFFLILKVWEGPPNV